MKITVAAAGVLTAAALAACGGGPSGGSGHSDAWQRGYDYGVRADPTGKEGMGDPTQFCKIIATGDGADEFVQGCIAGFNKR
jgi:hypothetical protein